MTARLAQFLLLAALVLGGVGGFAAWRSAAGPDPPFLIDPPDQDLGAVETGPHEVTFRVTNPADRPRRIIGLTGG